MAESRLAGVGLIPGGYKDIRAGFDLMVLDGLKIDPDATRTFIVQSRPSYPEFEAWIRSQEGADLSPENVDKVNRIVVERKKGADSREKMLVENGLPGHSPIADSVMLNNLDDWREIHAQLKLQPSS